MVNRFLPALLLTSLLAWAPARAETFAFNSLNLVIPDNNATGLTNTQTISSGISLIQSVRLDLNITGGFNGDLYAFLTRGPGPIPGPAPGFAVLLNRVGRTASDSDGYADSGFSVTFDDTATSAPPALGDIHLYGTVTSGSPITGTWQPDARDVDPSLVLDSSPRTAFLNSFAGGNANGTWTLFLADNASGGVSTLSSWSLHIEGIPEPGTSLLLVVGGALALTRRFRPRRG